MVKKTYETNLQTNEGGEVEINFKTLRTSLKILLNGKRTETMLYVIFCSCDIRLYNGRRLRQKLEKLENHRIDNEREDIADPAKTSKYKPITCIPTI